MKVLCAVGVALVWVLFLGIDGTQAQSGALPTLNIDLSQTSVSGLSAGAFFAVQFQVAFSSTIVGAGIFAGGPYDCAQGNLADALGPCMKGPPPSMSTLIPLTTNRASAGTIDNTTYLAKHKVYMFSGTDDTTVHQPVMDDLFTYYTNFIANSSIVYLNTVKAAHTMPTIDQQENACDVSKSPYISYCPGVDGAGLAMQQIYGTLNPRNDGTLSGTMISFDQGIYLSDPSKYSVAETGYAYIPKDCSQNATCKLLIAFHGCLQDYAAVNSQYIDNAGYNEWADTNSIVVLYPQIAKSSANPDNPNGCWNWWGYNDVSTMDTILQVEVTTDLFDAIVKNPQTYCEKSGYQMNMVYKMMQALGAGYVAIPAPTGVKVTAVTDSSVTLVWNAVSGAVGYAVSSDGDQINSNPITTTTFTATGLDSGSLYEFWVQAIAQGGGLSKPSREVFAITNGTAPPLVAPAGLTIVSSTNSSITLSWDEVAGAVSYSVARNGTKIHRPILTHGFTDTGLTASTYYEYTVSAINIQKLVGPASNPVIGETASDFACTSVTASNYDQVQQGRAYQKLGYCYADGSNDAMGLYSVGIKSTLSETSPDYWIVGPCPGN